MSGARGIPEPGGADPQAELATLVRTASSVVALTGAGISVPSGIPDFRSPGTGLWAGVDPMQVAHIDVFRRDPGRFWGFYGPRFGLLDDKQPNGAHRALAELEQRGVLDAVVTQNIDGLHSAAGSEDVVEVHGSLARSSCSVCERPYGREEIGARIEADPRSIPSCDCGGTIKPGVTLFGELLPVDAIERATELATRADLLLCVGTSLEVHPVAALPQMTLAAGGSIAIVTAGPTPYDAHAVVKLSGDVESELTGLAAAV